MNVTDELLFPKAVGVGVSFFLFLLSFDRRDTVTKIL